MPPRFAMIVATLALIAQRALGQTVFPPLPKVYFEAPAAVVEAADVQLAAEETE